MTRGDAGAPGCILFFLISSFSTASPFFPLVNVLLTAFAARRVKRKLADLQAFFVYLSSADLGVPAERRSRDLALSRERLCMPSLNCFEQRLKE